MPKAAKPVRQPTDRHKELGFIPNPDPAAFYHLPLIRTGERSSYTRCRFQWYLGNVKRLTRAGQPAKALSFGLMVHTALERYYIPGRKRGPHPAATFLEEYDRHAEEAGYDFSMMDDDEDWTAARDMGEDMLTRYVDHYREEDALWEVLAPEVPAMVVVLDKRGRPMCRYLMQYDAVVRHHGLGRNVFVDHKTAASMPDPEEKALDEQCGAYWTFGPEYLAANGFTPKNLDISGFVYNILRKATADTRPQNDKGQYLNKPTKDALVAKAIELELTGDRNARKMKVDDLTDLLAAGGVDAAQLGEVSKSQPPPHFMRFPVYRDEADRLNVLDRVRKQVYEMNLVRKGKLGVYKVPRFGGVGACPQCPFYGPCVLHENGADWKELLKLDYTDGDPYAQYRDLLDIEEQ